jgi:murein DD-endopeptidase MepM/ murein hydrolase activator NlpD
MREKSLAPAEGELSAEDWGPGFHLWQAFLAFLGQRGPDGTTSLVRVASHVMIILISVSVLLLARVQLPMLDLAELPLVVEAPDQAASAIESQPLEGQASLPEAPGSNLERVAVPFTRVQDRSRLEVLTHTVAPGDTLYAIAARYGISAETLIWANGMEMNPDLLRLGQQLVVIPVSGVYHTVVAGDTVDSVAKKYKADPAKIVTFDLNKLDPQNPVLTVGEKLIVPGGSKPQVVRTVQVYKGPVPAGAPTGTGRFVWPASGYISQGYKSLHRALDVAAGRGTQIKASDSGYVVVAGLSDVGYGYYVVIDHGNGFQSLYAHLDRYFVSIGDSVGKGAVIGLMGSTGNSTGPHLHFEVRENGVQRNPYNYLP